MLFLFGSETYVTRVTKFGCFSDAGSKELVMEALNNKIILHKSADFNMGGLVCAYYEISRSILLAKFMPYRNKLNCCQFIQFPT